MYVVGKTGMGKTTLLENMVLNDIYSGQGVGLVKKVMPMKEIIEGIIQQAGELRKKLAAI